MSQNPVTLQLRYLQTLNEIAAEKNSTILFPLPMDVITPFLGGLAEPGHHRSPREPASVR
jgi:hypothetical protein